jgi:hypothetical protein
MHVHYTHRHAAPTAENSIAKAVNGMLGMSVGSSSTRTELQQGKQSKPKAARALFPGNDAQSPPGMSTVWQTLVQKDQQRSSLAAEAVEAEPEVQAGRKGKLLTKWGSIKQGLKLKNASKKSAALSPKDEATSTSTTPQASLSQHSREAALTAQGRQAARIFAESVVLLRSGHKLGLNWEAEVGRDGKPVPGSVLEANAHRPDRWMLMPHEAAAAVRNGEDLSWHETQRLQSQRAQAAAAAAMR